MRNFFILILLFAGSLGAQDYVIVLHGGAGNGLSEELLTSAEQEAYRQSMGKALQLAAQCLDSGGTALDAVERVIIFLEDDSLFNAGRGAVLNWEGRASLDASIMDGQNRQAGAVAGLQSTKNPISAARAVLDSSPHVLLSGAGADAFAEELGLTLVPSDYFITRKSLRQWHRLRQSKPKPRKWGTVGCAILDGKGNLAAGTSTGGMLGKQHGRIGDSPLIGAGTYADNRTVAISCTGHGEYFIRLALAFNVHALHLYGGLSAQDAADRAIEELTDLGGFGGLIGVSKEGEVLMSFNTKGMLRGYLRQNQAPVLSIFAP